MLIANTLVFKVILIKIRTQLAWHIVEQGGLKTPKATMEI